MAGGKAIGLAEELVAQAAFGIAGLVETPVLKLRDNELDEIGVALGHDEARQVETVDFPSSSQDCSSSATATGSPTTVA